MGEEGRKNEAYDFGKFAEEIAAQEYLRKGYTILESRFRLGKNEIDIIAQKDNTVVIIEVKARSEHWEEALSAITTDKRKRMIRAADAFIRKLKGDYQYRFDIVTCTGNKNKYKLEIYEDAFLATDVF